MDKKSNLELQFMKIAKMYLCLVGWSTSEELSKYFLKHDFRLNPLSLTPSKIGQLLKTKNKYPFMKCIKTFKSGCGTVIYYHEDYEQLLCKELDL